MLQRAGLRDVHIRAAVLALQDQHPYKRLPVQFAASLRKRILDGNLLAEDELDRLVAECERIASDPDVIQPQLQAYIHPSYTYQCPPVIPLATINQRQIIALPEISETMNEK